MIFLGGHWFTAFTGTVMLIGAFEWRKLFGASGAQPILWILIAAILLHMLSFTRYSVLEPSQIFIMGSITGILIEIFRKTKLHFINIAVLVTGLLWIILLIGSMNTLRHYDTGAYEIGFELTMAMFVSVWICDSAAYLMGKHFGKRKFLPAVSPNKTWMGCVSGVAGSIASMAVFYYFDFFMGFLNLADLFALALIFGVAGQLGDFAESLLKREAKVKDTGTFLMGHGGVLDRFDSLAFTAPLTYIYAGYFII